MLANRKRKIRRAEGQIVRIDLKNGAHAYGRVLQEPLFAFYGKRYPNSESPSVQAIMKEDIAFRVWVMNYAVTKGVWPVIARVPLTSEELAATYPFFKQDPISGALSIYWRRPDWAPEYERPATSEECLGLEQAAVWEPEHVEDRLQDLFAGRPPRWVEAPVPPEQFRAQLEEHRRLAEKRDQ